MKLLMILVGVAIIGAIACLIGSTLSPDALGMALGIGLGVLAGVPTALLVLAAGRCVPTSEHADAPMDVGGDYCAVVREPPKMPVLMLSSTRQRQLAAPADETVDAEWRPLPTAGRVLR